MDSFFDFVVKHWDLWLVFVALVILAIRLETQTKISGVTLLSPSQVTQYINHQNAIVVDIRDADRYKQGHITGAIHVELANPEKQLKKLAKHKIKPIIVTCDDGVQSPRFGATLKKEQFDHIYALKGGIAAWQKENLPLAN